MQPYLYPKMKFRTVLRFFQCYLFNYFFSTKVMVLQVPQVPQVPDPRSADLRFSNTQAINSLHLLLRKNWNSLFLYAWINQTEFAGPIPMQKPGSSFSILSEKQSVEAVSCFVSTFSRKNDRVNVSIGGVWISFLLIKVTGYQTNNWFWF